jgi:signal transduction histidine kinase
VSDSAELRTIRMRLVSGALRERRRIERTLHDGVQQDLIAVSVRLQLVREALAGDPSGALELLDELQRDARDALGRLAALASEIYPAILDARGLPDALREAARTGHASVRLHTAGLGRYPSELEAAVYFACRAVLESAEPGAELRIGLGERDGELRLEIDGVDGAADLSEFEDLVAGSGGTLAVEPTRLRAAIPLP